jgi:hypothetical protein
MTLTKYISEKELRTIVEVEKLMHLDQVDQYRMSNGGF